MGVKKMLNIDAEIETFAYKVAVENKQLGFFINNSDFNLFDLIFDTLKRLENPQFKSFYFDWDLELSFIFEMADLFTPDCLMVLNVPFILENADYVKDSLNKLNLVIEQEESLSFSYLKFKSKKETFIDKRFLPSHGHLAIKNLFDFWRYFNYYAKKNVKETILLFLNKNVDEDFPYLVVKENPSLFNQITNQNLKALTEFSFKYFEHNLFFISLGNLSEIKKVLKLEKKYGVKIYALLESLNRFPTNQELKDWEIKVDIDFNKDLKIPLIKNKKLTVEFGWEIYELVSKKDLVEEAKYQHNCLEGYVPSLANSNHRFFSCRKKAERFTMRFIGTKLIECKGRFNKLINTYSQNIQEEIEYCILTIKEILKNGRK